MRRISAPIRLVAASGPSVASHAVPLHGSSMKSASGRLGFCDSSQKFSRSSIEKVGSRLSATQLASAASSISSRAFASSRSGSVSPGSSFATKGRACTSRGGAGQVA